MFTYGLNDVDKDNFDRLLSAKSNRGVADLAVGHGYIINLPKNRVFLLDNFYIKVNTGVALGNRLVTLRLFDLSSTLVWGCCADFVQLSGRTIEYSFARLISSNLGLNALTFIQLPDLPIFEDSYFEIFVDNIQSGDTFEGGQYNYRDLYLNSQ